VEFVLVLEGDDGHDASAAELGGRTGRLSAWLDRLRAEGVVRTGGHVDGPVLRVRTRDGRMAAVDVATADRSVRSWLLIEARSLDAALAVARSCPEVEHGDVRVLAVDPEGSVP
jgi:hypothetical protein